MASEPYELAVESVARSGTAIALVPQQYSSWRGRPGVVCRSLSPRLLFDIGVIFRRDDPLRPLADLLGLLEEVVPPDVLQVPEDGELIVSSPLTDATANFPAYKAW